MDEERFDRWTRLMAAGSPRRRLLGGLFAGALAGAVGGAERVRQRAARKTGICHRTNSDTNEYVFIEVSMNAADAHSNHEGDTIGVDLMTDPNNCGECGNACVAEDACHTVACREGHCRQEAVACDDGNACTTSTCDPERGCVHAPVVCSGEYQTCVNGTCQCQAGTTFCGGFCRAEVCRPNQVRNPETCRCDFVPDGTCRLGGPGFNGCACVRERDGALCAPAEDCSQNGICEVDRRCTCIVQTVGAPASWGRKQRRVQSAPHGRTCPPEGRSLGGGHHDLSAIVMASKEADMAMAGRGRTAGPVPFPVRRVPGGQRDAWHDPDLDPETLRRVAAAVARRELERCAAIRAGFAADAAGD